MDRIELAERRYRGLVPEVPPGDAAVERFATMPLKHLETWLETDVCAAVAEVIDRPLFQQHATWPQRTLMPGSGTAERGMVEDVDRWLVSAGQALKELAGQRLVSRQLEALHAPRKVSVAGNVRIGPRTNQVPAREIVLIDDLRDLRSEVDRIVGHHWTDLVRVEDYFGPSGLSLDPQFDEQAGVHGRMAFAMHPKLLSVGDCLTRCMVQRVFGRIQALTAFNRLCMQAVRATSRPYSQLVEASRQTLESLQATFRNLKNGCLGASDFRFRDSCIALTQVYAEFHPEPHLDWLGIPPTAIRRWRGQRRHMALHAVNVETLDRIAAALGDLRLLYRDMSPEDSARDQAVATRGLVLVEAPRQAYWDGSMIEVDWHKHKSPWKFLWLLAEKVRVSATVGERELLDDSNVGSSTMANQKRRLAGLLPSSLRKHIVPGGARATYRLDLPTIQVHLFPARRTHPGRPR